MSLPSYLTCAGGMGGQILRASSISSTLGRSHCTLFCSPVLQMWSRRAARIARPRSLSPLLMEADRHVKGRLVLAQGAKIRHDFHCQYSI